MVLVPCRGGLFNVASWHTGRGVDAARKRPGAPVMSAWPADERAVLELENAHRLEERDRGVAEPWCPQVMRGRWRMGRIRPARRLRLRAPKLPPPFHAVGLPTREDYVARGESSRSCLGWIGSLPGAEWQRTKACGLGRATGSSAMETRARAREASVHVPNGRGASGDASWPCREARWPCGGRK